MRDMLERLFLFPSDWQAILAGLVPKRLHKDSVARSFEETNSWAIPTCAERTDDSPEAGLRMIAKIATYARCEQLGDELDEIERWLPELADDQRRCEIIDEVLKFRAELALISAELTHGPARIWRPADLSQSSVACSFEEAA
jgi:hypothetical protein